MKREGAALPGALVDGPDADQPLGIGGQAARRIGAGRGFGRCFGRDLGGGRRNLGSRNHGRRRRRHLLRQRRSAEQQAQHQARRSGHDDQRAGAAAGAAEFAAAGVFPGAALSPERLTTEPIRPIKSVAPEVSVISSPGLSITESPPGVSET